MPDDKTPKRILVVNVNWLGDVIFSTAFIRAVKKMYPDSHLACMVVPRCKEALEKNPRVDEVILFDEGGSEKGLIGKICFALKLRRNKFDTVFILHRSFTKALMMYLAGIKERIGYDTKGRGIFLTKKLKQPGSRLHKVDYFLKLAEAAGVDISDGSYEFFVTDADREKAGIILERLGIGRGERFVVLNPGGNWGPKRWPAGNFSKLADMLAEKYGVKILISGAAKDENLAREISGKMNGEAASLCGRTAIRELAAILEKARLVVSGDSGPMHIAAAIGASTVAIFGPTDPKITGPRGRRGSKVIKSDTDCRVPCYDLNCRDNKCMQAVSADDVMRVIEEEGYLRGTE